MTRSDTRFGQYQDFLTDEEELRTTIGAPLHQMTAKELTELDGICRDFIGKSPICVIATANPAGHIDVSPRGDPPGFATVLGDRLLAVPDRPGNKRADTFHNLLQDDRIGLLFLVPGRGETLRIRGAARICRDPNLLAAMAINGRPPKLALLVHVETAFKHCPKCIMRSNLWQADKWQGATDLADMNTVMVKHAQIAATPEAWFQNLMAKGELDLY